MPERASTATCVTPQWTQLRLLAAASGISAFGSFLNMVVLGLYALEVTGSALMTGLFMALRLGSGFLAGPLAGVLAARLPRRTLMMACDLASAAGLLVIVLAPADWGGALLYVLAVLLGAGPTVWNVAARSAVPDLVGQENRVRANGIMVSFRSGATLLGFAASGVVLLLWDSRAAFAIDAATFTLSALLVSRVALGRVGAGDGEAPAVTTPWGSTRVALLALGAAPVLAWMVSVRTLDAFGSAAHNVGLPIYATLTAPENPAAFASVFTTAWAVGTLAAGRMPGRLRDVIASRPEPLFAIGTCAMSAFFVLAFTGLPTAVLIPVAVAAGLADGVTEIAYTSRLQAADAGRRTHLLGFAAMTQYAGMGLGSVLAAAAMESFHPLPVIAAGHVVPAAAAVFFLLLIIHRVRAARTAR
ncbi:MFS transporter [Phytomonospora sp. NPDC050363]|uniref:MFS transporter n=1 Tax=Phytomonospora sp. NPDC050363 TaxID=3155642 RepID=UPI0033D30F9B